MSLAYCNPTLRRLVYRYWNRAYLPHARRYFANRSFHGIASDALVVLFWLPILPCLWLLIFLSSLVVRMAEVTEATLSRRP